MFDPPIAVESRLGWHVEVDDLTATDATDLSYRFAERIVGAWGRAERLYLDRPRT